MITSVSFLKNSKTSSRPFFFSAYFSLLSRMTQTRSWSVVGRARPLVLTPVPSQTNYSFPLVAVGSRRVKIVGKLHTRQSPASVPRDTPEKVPNSRQRTVMANGALSDTESGMMFNWSSLAVGSYTTRRQIKLRPWTSSTRSNITLSQSTLHFPHSAFSVGGGPDPTTCGRGSSPDKARAWGLAKWGDSCPLGSLSQAFAIACRLPFLLLLGFPAQAASA